MQAHPGFLITFEGGEGCGKSTQARLLYNKLQQHSIASLLTQEPGGTPLGNKIRSLLKIKRDFPISPLSELFLFSACRSQLIQDVIGPALDTGRVVVCDRFSALDLKLIDAINTSATGGLKPDVTILLDILPEQGLQRKKKVHEDRFDSEELSFHQSIREGYLDLAAKEPGRWLVLQAGLPVNKLSQLAWDHVRPLIARGRR
ncbi:MAG: dTMP kinase [Chloroflexi bacterium]|nr:dTMP kinase [Chloroflexota bacterium]